MKSMKPSCSLRPTNFSARSALIMIGSSRWMMMRLSGSWMQHHRSHIPKGTRRGNSRAEYFQKFLELLWCKTNPPRAQGRGGSRRTAGRSDRLYVGYCGSPGLWEIARCSQKQCPEQPIGEREHDIVVFPHVLVVQEVVSIEPAKYSSPLDPPIHRGVEAPVQSFVHPVVSREGKESRPKDGPPFGVADEVTD